jgi:hypothetical protein
MKAAVAILSTLTPLLACGDAFSPPPGLEFSTIGYTCTLPLSGAATVLILTGKTEFPYLFVMSGRMPDVQGGTWVAPSDSVSARYVTAPGQSELGSGSVTFKPAIANFPLQGAIDLQFASQHITGAFRPRRSDSIC